MLENAILLVGLGSNKFKLNEIVETTDLNYIKNNFGSDSCFYKASSVAKRFGQDHDLYILNLDTWEDIKDQEDILLDLNFDYIVPLDLYIDDAYYDRYYQKKLTYSQLILLLLHKTITTMILTGPHANNYETLDAYLEAESDRISNVEYRYDNLRKNGMIYVANMLSNYDYANVILASILANTEYGQYPESSLLINPVFDIDYRDISNRIVYFKDNYLTGVTIENLVNFDSDYTIRLVPVYKIIKYFYFHKADLDKYIGLAYTEYRKLKIQEELFKFLDSLVDWIIYKYELISITVVSNEYGSVDIMLRYNIWPKFTTEKYTIETSL